MRRKLLSLFVLLLTASSGAWAETTTVNGMPEVSRTDNVEAIQNFKNQPTVQIVGTADGTDHRFKVRINAGQHTNGYEDVTTFYYFDDSWTEVSNPTWNSFTGASTEILISWGKILHVRSVYKPGNVNDESNTIHTKICGDEVGIEVHEMTQSDNGYYNPTLRLYVNAGLVWNNKNDVTLTLNYTPIDYGTVNSTEATENEDGSLFVQPYSETYNGSALNEETIKKYKHGEADANADNVKRYYVDFVVPRSAFYSVNVTKANTNINVSSPSKAYYWKKYKETYHTPNFSDENALNNENGWSDWSTVKYDRDYRYRVWNHHGNDIYTSVMNSDVAIVTGNNHQQTYNLRTVQQTGDANSSPMEVRIPWGIVKPRDVAWNYRGSLVHIGMGNEIVKVVYHPYGSWDQVTFYPTPTFVETKNTPEVSFVLPHQAALNSYKVYTPVERVAIPSYGLKSYSSYYRLYTVNSDKYLNNMAHFRAFYAPNGAYKYGGDYYLKVNWNIQDHEGMLLAHEGYYPNDKNNIWEQHVTTDLDHVEIRILDNYGNPLTNELRPVLFDNETIEHDRYTLPAASPNNVNGYPNMILYSGTFDGNTCYNFFTMSKVTSVAKMNNKTSYLQVHGSTYKDFGGNQGIKLFLNSGDWDDSELVGIGDIRENPAEMERMNNNAYYTISGQKVDTPTRGLYIHNGKKVIVK